MYVDCAFYLFSLLKEKNKSPKNEKESAFLQSLIIQVMTFLYVHMWYPHPVNLYISKLSFFHIYRSRAWGGASFYDEQSKLGYNFVNCPSCKVELYHVVTLLPIAADSEAPMNI